MIIMNLYVNDNANIKPGYSYFQIGGMNSHFCRATFVSSNIYLAEVIISIIRFLTKLLQSYAKIVIFEIPVRMICIGL